MLWISSISNQLRLSTHLASPGPPFSLSEVILGSRQLTHMVWNNTRHWWESEGWQSRVWGVDCSLAGSSLLVVLDWQYLFRMGPFDVSCLAPTGYVTLRSGVHQVWKGSMILKDTHFHLLPLNSARIFTNSSFMEHLNWATQMCHQYRQDPDCFIQ